MTLAIDATQGAEKIEQWILKRKKELTDVDHDEDLIENRLIDSLAFVEFLLYLEELSGNEVPLDSIDVEDFRTINSIVAKYLQG
ncbi:acyl carrier protein [Mycobacterium sp. CBMA271]|uniref:acyl carrier protein n=1 Tax=unclassified Mycobacteroides TaxID=2618759 RepID=UPI0012DD69F4|nr:MULTISPECIES: acyl carrier protein [unclassified Mycobacteroides]MUM18787.1 holo [Mycobacteroides sp. CBMA 326]MUM22750.1 acyl carrier protein [Mycobacteroides sp. CBMA 271]